MSQQQNSCSICGDTDNLINLDCDHPVCRECFPRIKRYRNPEGTITPNFTSCPTCRANIERDIYERQGIPFPPAQDAPLYSMYGPGNQLQYDPNQEGAQPMDTGNNNISAINSPSDFNSFYSSNNNNNNNTLMDYNGVSLYVSPYDRATYGDEIAEQRARENYDRNLAEWSSLRARFMGSSESMFPTDQRTRDSSDRSLEEFRERQAQIEQQAAARVNNNDNTIEPEIHDQLGSREVERLRAIYGDAIASRWGGEWREWIQQRELLPHARDEVERIRELYGDETAERWERDWRERPQARAAMRQSLEHSVSRQAAQALADLSDPERTPSPLLRRRSRSHTPTPTPPPTPGGNKKRKNNRKKRTKRRKNNKRKKTRRKLN